MLPRQQSRARQRDRFRKSVSGHQILTGSCFTDGKQVTRVVQVAVALRQIADGRSIIVSILSRKNSRLSDWVVVACLCAASLVSCAPDRGSTTSTVPARPVAMVCPPQHCPAQTCPVPARCPALRKCPAPPACPAAAQSVPLPKPSARTPIPLPHHTLLAPQAEPDCESKAQAQPNQTDADAERAERDCYRQAEVLVRTRLRLLQAAFAETIKAVLEPAASDDKTGSTPPQ